MHSVDCMRIYEGEYNFFWGWEKAINKYRNLCLWMHGISAVCIVYDDTQHRLPWGCLSSKLPYCVIFRIFSVLLLHMHKWRRNSFGRNHISIKSRVVVARGQTFVGFKFKTNKDSFGKFQRKHILLVKIFFKYLGNTKFPNAHTLKYLERLLLVWKHEIYAFLLIGNIFPTPHDVVVVAEERIFRKIYGLFCEATKYI